MKLVNQIKRHEGLSLNIYHCSVGKITIGFGRNLEDKGISEKEAEILLINDINQVKKQLKNKLPVYKSNNLSDVRKAVIINMAFNLGVNGLLKFKNMIRALELCNYDLAAKEMLCSKWANQVGYRAKELAMQMKTDQWQ